MKALVRLLQVLLVPATGVVLLALWAVRTFPFDSQPVSEWAAALLLGGFAIAAAAPRLAIAAADAGFLLQLVRADRRFGPVGWVAYGAVVLMAVVLAARSSEAWRRRRLVAILPLGVLVGLFTNLPGRASSDPASWSCWPAR